MKTSTDRILTTHTGSLPRPDLLTDRRDAALLRAAVAETVRRQLAGSDCGFATFSASVKVDPRVTWAKLAAMSEGARLASGRLWA
jgi:5-methyltetrahydropteroyltriglutamate--homocysteine methyltransferase